MERIFENLVILNFFEYFAAVCCTTTIVGSTNYGDYTEFFAVENLSTVESFSTLEGRTIEPQDFESDPLGLNFEPSERPESSTRFYNVTEDWSPELPVFRWTKKPTELRREAESVPRMLISYYESDFKQRYAQYRNYSEIFENSGREVTLKSSRNFPFGNYSFTSFPRLNEIYEYLTVLEKSSEGRAVIVPLQHNDGSWSNVHTNFGNEILSIRIAARTAVAHERNSIIVVVAGIHGKDWYAVQSAIFVASELILNANRTSRHDLDWWIIPVLNPDGYEITHTGSEWRDWEKNLQGMRETNISKCFGIDLDSNFEYQWISCNSSTCDSDFPGELPFSSAEARGLRDTLEAFDYRCDSFVALKEGRQLLLYPFSDTLESPRNLDSINEISKAAVEAFRKKVEGKFEQGQSSHLLDIKAGFIEDWAKVHLGVEKSFAFYLGPTDKDRRDLKSQHLMDHMNGTYDLLEIIASGKIHRKSPRNSSPEISLSLVCIALNILEIA